MLAHFRGRRVICALFVTLLFSVFLLTSTYKEDLRESVDRWHNSWSDPQSTSQLRSPFDIFQSNGSSIHPHPIDTLLNRSIGSWQSLLAKRSYTQTQAASAYRARRGRHPPPHFDKWVQYAQAHGCVIVEDFFDQIYRDIEPFWGVPAEDIRRSASSSSKKISIRNGTASQSTDEWHFIRHYFDMFKTIEKYLPDVDIPINVMDESRIIVPWEEVGKLLGSSHTTQDMFITPLVHQYSTIEGDPQTPDDETAWSALVPYWDAVRVGCPPNSPGRQALSDTNFSSPPEFSSTWPEGSHLGYVSNWTSARDPCIHAHLRYLHGSFVEPISISTTTKMLPMFGGSKLPMSNDILLPAALYWHDEERFALQSRRISWNSKRNEVLWRGTASGGRNRAENWTRFQRHRLVSILNGTQIRMALRQQDELDTGLLNGTEKLPVIFPLPDQDLYPLQSSALGLLPEWIQVVSNVAFTWLACFPGTKSFGCSYTGQYYRKGFKMPFDRMFYAKYLPDVDGNSFSGRFRAFLQSNSVPIKATIYSEWHDDRLMPWMHFLPMDNTFVDLWAILEYLFSHDELASWIGSMGREAAETLLRKEDMLAYVYRLILEYARVSDDRRELMGWVEAQDSK
ncbi:hypothetical protein LTR84_003887 [Exophiala bonariae]|uniref:Glycosyl transferase CAP10 domain-containing protein n=1 Tax=Exophiala bonariae TaxID=1690606 RepID=A0AAV9N6G7_9EURO|nr:hypothetical protein LTR84_003887 [Exophiala bonariae]